MKYGGYTGRDRSSSGHKKPTVAFPPDASSTDPWIPRVAGICRRNRVGHREPVRADKAGVAAAIHPASIALHSGIQSRWVCEITTKLRWTSEGVGATRTMRNSASHSRGASLAVASIQPCLKRGKKTFVEFAEISTTRSARESRTKCL